MNSVNPFQIPTCFQIDAERRRRERFKKAVIAFIIGCVLLLVGFLIAGCVSERSGAKVVPPAAERHIAPSTSHFFCLKTVSNLNVGMDKDV
jgi:Na+/proline symporter